MKNSKRDSKRNNSMLHYYFYGYNCSMCCLLNKIGAELVCQRSCFKCLGGPSKYTYGCFLVHYSQITSIYANKHVFEQVNQGGLL